MSIVEAETLLLSILRHARNSVDVFAPGDRDAIERYFEKARAEDRIRQARVSVALWSMDNVWDYLADGGSGPPPVFSVEHPSNELLRERAASLLAKEREVNATG